jgi:selenide,water dikinase
MSATSVVAQPGGGVLSGSPRLVLAGCGHAHLFVLEALAAKQFPRVHVTLVSPAEQYFYSGMASGVIASQYDPKQACFHPSRLAQAAGAEWVCASVTDIDAEARRVSLDDGRVLAYDLLSLDIGARLTADHLPGVQSRAIPVKPVHDAFGIGTAADAAIREASPARPARIVVVGGGAAGVEITICLSARLHRDHRADKHRIMILEAGAHMLSQQSESARDKAGAVLRARKIEVRTRVRVEMVQDGFVVPDSGTSIPFDVLVWATGPRAPDLFRDSGLPTDDKGYLRVDDTLQAEGHPTVFGAGDCVSLVGHSWVAKAGVYAVRQGPVLARNLAAFLRGDPLDTYRPQTDWLSLVNLGDGRGLMTYRGYAAVGRPEWWLKDWIDRRFMRRFQRLEN